MAKRIITNPNAPAPLGPYNQAILAGDTLFVSGQIAVDQSTGKMITDEIQSETHQVMQNLQYVLESAGMTFENVVKCSIFVKDLENFEVINKIYGSYFDENTAPARETVEVARLPKDVNIEISCIAVR